MPQSKVFAKSVFCKRCAFLQIIKKIEFNKYLVEIIGTNDKLIMQRLGDSKQVKNTKLKKDIKIEMK